MAVTSSWMPPIFILQFFFLCSLIISGNTDGYTVTARVKIPGFSLKGSGLSAKASNVKVILNGGQRVTFLRPDGYFSLSLSGFQVRVDVSARNPGKVQAALTENRRSLIELVLEPLSEEQYYEIKEPFSIMSLVKTPVGLMIGFTLFVMFLMPKLAENMDPEEIRRTQEEMRNQGVPTLSSLLPRAQRAATRESRQD
ncbi:PREDICTED: ER membrane protein complex subunit 7 homolog isoform X2 [Nicotiana attenuata]|uniref:ER membrane protein complex subunit 7 homolog isoform X2 n=1 Tax=Nicotiana attenuata TaxID=49451 RepID=UPI000904831D|nr:PREDICTED: ER membrane protein complex subunit 7 homolog isoform X2 [Nicotiana attenuata]